MDYMHTIIVGIIQGLTEFLPISSSGHIVLTSAVYKFLTGQDFSVATDEEIFFDIMVHLGTLIAVCIYFRKELLDIFKAFCLAVKNRRFESYESLLPVYIFVGTFFTCVIVYCIKDFCESLVSSPAIVGITLMITGVILFASEILSKKFEQKIYHVDMKKSILIGLAQGIAAIPGISRSGSTIATGLALGLDRVNAAKYSFLLSISVILIAAIYHIPEVTKPEIFMNISWIPILVGTLVSAFVGYFCIKYFLAFLNRFSLNLFAYYCFSIGLITFLCFSFA